MAEGAIAEPETKIVWQPGLTLSDGSTLTFPLCDSLLEANNEADAQATALERQGIKVAICMAIRVVVPA